MPIGYHLDGRKTRCYDRFVRYPYPSKANSYYQKEFQRKGAFAKDHKRAFNLEKEAKIINPHKMDLQTTQRQVHDGSFGKRADLINFDHELGERPMQLNSSYKMNYPNWKNGNADVFHEKHPQYPIYWLPFRGDSQYKESFTPDQMSKIRNQTIRV